MEEKLKSEGVCVFCNFKHTKSTITKHLTKHLDEITKENPTAKTKGFHLKVSTGPYFLHLFMDVEATLTTLDKFLKDIWLECCGHSSSFSKIGKFYDNNWDDIKADIGEKKRQKAKDVFEVGGVLKYEYDFGSTTELEIKTLGIYPYLAKGAIQILSRNEPLKLMCDVCKTKAATEICEVHLHEGSPAFFCDGCAEEHEKVCEDFADYAHFPVVNSPRMGVCAYDGGTIDKRRDGVYVI